MDQNLRHMCPTLVKILYDNACPHILVTNNLMNIEPIGLCDFFSPCKLPKLSQIDFHYFKLMDNFLQKKISTTEAQFKMLLKNSSRNPSFYTTRIALLHIHKSV